MTTQIEFEGKDIEICSAFASADIVVVSFSNYGPEPNARFGDGFLQKNGFSSIFVTAKSNHWWQSEETAEALEIVRRLISKYSRRVAYGNSMGGFGALAFAGDINVTHVYAFAPQTCISGPGILLHRAWRANIERRPVIRGRSDMGLGNIVPTVIYDPYNVYDRAQVSWLQQKREIRRIITPFAGHHVLTFLKEAGVTSAAVRPLLWNDSAALFRNEIRRGRSRSFTYLGNAALSAIQRRKVALANALASRLDALDPGTEFISNYERQRLLLTKALGAASNRARC